MRFVFLIALCFVVAKGAPNNPQRIVGGAVTTISEYPNIASLLFSWDLSSYWQNCGGIVINVKAILTAAHCPSGDAPARWRARVGSTYANSGGVVHSLDSIIIHPNFNTRNLDNDIAVLRTSQAIVYLNNVVQPAIIAGSNYNLKDDEQVWAAGWGTTSAGGQPSEQLRHVQIWTVNQDVCSNRYSTLGLALTENMVCSGWLNVGGRDQCQGDSGGPLYHNKILVGICSWGWHCALPFYPGVNVRVSRYTSWIQASA